MNAKSNEPRMNRFVRSRELMAITGLSRTTIWRLERSGQFPCRRQLSPGAVGWLWEDVNVWLESRQEVGKREGPNG